MYSFEGDYRQKPQQNLAGASKRGERTALLQHALLERQKREQHRIKHNAMIKIQAYLRSIVVRKLCKKKERCEFSKLQQLNGARQLSLDELMPFVRRILFFYSHKCDNNRLIWVLQHILRLHKEIIQTMTNELCITNETQFYVLSTCNSTLPIIINEWLWRIRWILKVCMEYSSEVIVQDASQSAALPFRILEIFTAVDESNNDSYLRYIFAYLVQHQYFKQIKKLLSAKLPSLTAFSSRAPTPMATYLLEMIQKPLTIVHRTDNSDFCFRILKEFFCEFLSHPMTDPVFRFIIPALSEFEKFPYEKLIRSVNHVTPTPTVTLFYSILTMEPIGHVFDKSKIYCVEYLQVLALMSSTFIATSLKYGMRKINHDDTDSDADPEVFHDDEFELKSRCIEKLNDENRVQRILQFIDQSNDQTLMQPLCQLCHNLLISNRNAVHKYKLLYMLAFKPQFLRQLWDTLSMLSQPSLFDGNRRYLQIISRGIALSTTDSEKIIPLVAVFCSLFSLLIATLHDREFFGDLFHDVEEIKNPGQQAMPFTVSELVILSAHLKNMCLGLIELAFPDTRPIIREDYKNAVYGSSTLKQNQQNIDMWSHLLKVTVALLRQLHTRDLRNKFCPNDHWIASNIAIPIDKIEDFSIRRRRLLAYTPFNGTRGLTKEEIEDGPPLSTREVRTFTLLREIPFVVPFNSRVVLLQSLISRDKKEQQGELSHFMQGPSIHISVRRNYLYEDAFAKLSPENEPDIRLKMRVQLVNTAGLEEAGVDGGGLFREFLTELLKTCFDPNRGFFRLTKDNMLYPNPTVQLLFDNFPKHYYFIGRILGKALYENLLVELPFAEFFLSKVVGTHSDVDIHHLASLDPIMYRNLLYLKSYKNEVKDLGLDFTVLSDELGERRIAELKPEGANIAVTNNNRIEYIHLMADYKLNKQIRAQCHAFKQGIGSIIPLDWLQMFNNKELQVLISGAPMPINVSDLKQYTNYTGGYTIDHPTIVCFWKVVSEFDDLQKSQLLKFVTSCSRPPLLGFKELDPPFCIQHAGGVDRLPTSSTCMNLLKLPEFMDEDNLRNKLLYAIQSGAGFELS